MLLYGEKENNRIFTITNLSPDATTVNLIGKEFKGNYVDVFDGSEKKFKKDQEISLDPWEYLVYISK